MRHFLQKFCMRQCQSRSSERRQKCAAVRHLKPPGDSWQRRSGFYALQVAGTIDRGTRCLWPIDERTMLIPFVCAHLSETRMKSRAVVVLLCFAFAGFAI